MIRPEAIPNVITVARIAVTPAIFFLCFVRGLVPGILTFVFFLAAAISDLWDGHLARKHGWISDFGKFWDPIADKLLVACTFIPFYIVSQRPGPIGDMPLIGELPMWVLLVIFGREFLVTIVRSYAAGQGVVIPAGKAGKHKAVYQNIFVGSILFWWALQDGARDNGWSGGFWDLWQSFHTTVAMVALAIALVLTIWSMGIYFWNWRKTLRATVT